MSHDEAIAIFQARAAEIDARIALIEATKTQTIASLTVNVPSTLMSQRFPDDLARPFDVEVLWLRREREKAAVEFAETFIDPSEIA